MASAKGPTRPFQGKSESIRGCFFTDDVALDPIYVSHRDHDSKAKVRARIERMWAKYGPYCPDTHYLTDARAHFVARTWEMYLACAMLDAGLKLARPPAKG